MEDRVFGVGLQDGGTHLGGQYTSGRAVRMAAHIRNELAFLPLAPPSAPALVPPQRRPASGPERPRHGAQRHDSLA